MDAHQKVKVNAVDRNVTAAAETYCNQKCKAHLFSKYSQVHWIVI
jgi:hypothetical protein